MSDIVTRIMDGTLEVAIDFPDMSTWTHSYNHYQLRRKEYEYPVDETDGILLEEDDLALTGVSTDYADTDVQDGVVWYYRIFARLTVGGTYETWQSGYGMGLVPNFDEISDTFIPMALRREYAMLDSSNPQVLQRCFIDPVFGEVEALVRNMGVNWDVDRADPHALSNLVRILNWWSSPLMRLTDFRVQVKALVANYWNKGQALMEHDLMEDISQLPVEIEEWHDNIEVLNEAEAQTTYEKTVIGVGDGVTAAFNYDGDFAILPYTVEVTDGVTTLSDTAGDGILYTDETIPVAAGTVTYATGVVAAVFPAGHIPAMGTSVWVTYDFHKGFTDLDDPETQTRVGYLGDRCLYGVSQRRNSRQSGVALSVYFMLHIEVGEEGVFTFSGSYDKVYVDDIIRKAEVIWPAFGNTEFVFVDRSIVAFDIEDYTAHLPVERVMEVLD